MNLLRLINYKYLALLAIAQLVFRYGFLELQANLPIALSDWQYALFVLSSVCIAGGGFLINNVISAGRISAESLQTNYKISESKAYNFYAALNIIGVGIGFYLANYIGSSGFALLFIAISGTLYLYASSLRQSLLIGNFIIAIIAALAIIGIGIFNLYPVITATNRPQLSLLFRLFIDYGIFTFFIVLVLTFVRDLIDSDTDYNSGATSLPIALGRGRTAKVAFAVAIIPVALLLYYANTYIVTLLWALIYGLVFILGPLIYFLIKIWSAATRKEFVQLGKVLDMVLFFTALSIAVIT
ncbi:MAG: prenyltransferase, partial [Flavobacterium sp.]